jgi:hypothetical protein
MGLKLVNMSLVDGVDEFTAHWKRTALVVAYMSIFDWHYLRHLMA